MLLSTDALLFLLCMAASSAMSQNVGENNPAQHGWTTDNPTAPDTPSHWLRQHGRVAIIVVLGSVILGLILWYIIRGIKGMRKRLREENEKHFSMIQQMSAVSGQAASEPPPPPAAAAATSSSPIIEHSPTPPTSAQQSDSVLPLKHSSTLYQTAVDIPPYNGSPGQQQQQQQRY